MKLNYDHLTGLFILTCFARMLCFQYLSYRCAVSFACNHQDDMTHWITPVESARL